MPEERTRPPEKEQVAPPQDDPNQHPDDNPATCTDSNPWRSETHNRLELAHDAYAIAAFNARGLAALRKGSSRPHRFRVAFDLARGEQLRALLHQSPRTFGKPTSVWTLELAADVSFEHRLTPERVSGETIRATLQRLGIRWKRAKRWITSPDPEYARKKVLAIA